MHNHRRTLYLSPELDGAGMPPHVFRVYCHSLRRMGGKRSDPDRNPGIDSIAKVCRMDKSVVIKAIRWLEQHGYLTVWRIPGRGNRYRLSPKAKDKVFIASWLDDYGLSVTQFRVLAHASAVANENGVFHVNESDFGRVCGIKRDTVSRAALDLVGLGLIGYELERKNPQYLLCFDDVAPKAQTPIKEPQDVTRNVNKHVARNVKFTGKESHADELAEIRNGSPRKDSSENCPKDVTVPHTEEAKDVNINVNSVNTGQNTERPCPKDVTVTARITERYCPKDVTKGTKEKVRKPLRFLTKPAPLSVIRFCWLRWSPDSRASQMLSR